MRRHSLSFFLLTLALVIPQTSLAKNIYFALGLGNEPVLNIENTSNQDGPFFIQYRDYSQQLVELTFWIQPHEKKQISLDEMAPLTSWILLKSELPIKSSVQLSKMPVKLQGTEDLSREVSFSFVPKGAQLLVSNLSPVENSIQLKSGWGPLTTLVLLPYSSKQIQMERTHLQLELSATQRIKALSFSSNQEFPAQLQPELVQQKTNKVYFVFGLKEGPQFTVGLEDPRHIQKARELIKNPNSLGGILSAAVSFGNQNHNFQLPSRPSWSWEVSAIYGFYDFGSTECNGNAQQLEEIAEEWIKNNKPICFWTSKPLKELPALP